MNTYCFWNIQNTGCPTYQDLLELEQDGYSHSSFVTLTDPEEVVNCVLNETNADLGYHLVSTVKPVINLTDTTEQHDLDSCIIGGEVYQAKPAIDACEGCAFGSNGLPEHCNKVACTRGRRDDGVEVIWVQIIDHDTGGVL